VFLGSYNLSRSGERNAENVLELNDSQLADRLATFGSEQRAGTLGSDALGLRSSHPPSAR